MISTAGCQCDDNVNRALALISVEPTSLDFGAVTAGEEATRLLLVKNTGSAELLITGVAILDDPDGAFSFTRSETPIRLPGGGMFSLRVAYSRAEAVVPQDTARLRLENSSENAPEVFVPLLADTVIARMDAGVKDAEVIEADGGDAQMIEPADGGDAQVIETPDGGDAQAIDDADLPDAPDLPDSGVFDAGDAGLITGWAPTSTIGAPAGRFNFVTEWTGREMIIWGGNTPAYENTGGRYDPYGDRWTATTTTGAPSPRVAGASVWTGSEMIVWGGFFSTMTSVHLGDGALYDPAADSWRAMSNAGRPAPRVACASVWTGAEMIVWGGRVQPSTPTDTGARYNPATDTWTPMSTIGAPTPRVTCMSVWTGSELLVWGGFETVGISIADTGARYHPATDTWAPMSTTGAPTARTWAAAAWSGSEMMIWGGYDNTWLGDGARYDPASDTWTPMTATGAPSPRYLHSGVWTGSQLIIWGGASGSTHYEDGALYDPISDSWTPTSLVNAPDGRRDHGAVWADTMMIVWGSTDETNVNFDTGGRYLP